MLIDLGFRLGKVSGFTGSVRCMGLNRFCVMQISNTVLPYTVSFISKPDPGIPQQRHVPTPSGPTSAYMAVKTVLCVKTLSSYSTILSPQDYFMNRHDIVKFSDVSWTSTRDTEQK